MEPGKPPGNHRGGAQTGGQRSSLPQHKSLIHHPSKREEQLHQHHPAQGGSTRNRTNLPRHGERNMSTLTRCSNGLNKLAGTSTILIQRDAPRGLSRRYGPTTKNGRLDHPTKPKIGREDSGPKSTRRRKSPRVLHREVWKDTIMEMHRHLV